MTKTYGYEVEASSPIPLISGTAPRLPTNRGEVGRDLQFIRINGTLIGGLVGLAIYTVSFLIKQL
ncbi:MAG: DUF445 family protein [Anaerolineae bacterium]